MATRLLRLCSGEVRGGELVVHCCSEAQGDGRVSFFRVGGKRWNLGKSKLCLCSEAKVSGNCGCCCHTRCHLSDGAHGCLILTGSPLRHTHTLTRGLFVSPRLRYVHFPLFKMRHLQNQTT